MRSKAHCARSVCHESLLGAVYVRGTEATTMSALPRGQARAVIERQLEALGLPRGHGVRLSQAEDPRPELAFIGSRRPGYAQLEGTVSRHVAAGRAASAEQHTSGASHRFGCRRPTRALTTRNGTALRKGSAIAAQVRQADPVAIAARASVCGLGAILAAGLRRLQLSLAEEPYLEAQCDHEQ